MMKRMLSLFLTLAMVLSMLPTGLFSETASAETEGIYTIIYHLDGGTNAPENPAVYTEEDSITLVDATKDGYNFAGWFSDADKTKQITEVSGTGNVDVYAKWEIVKRTDTAKNGDTVTECTITWRDSNGTLLKTTSCEYGETPTFGSETPTKESDTRYNYTFARWAPEIKAAYGDVEYIAVYNITARTSYVITYDANGGSNAPSSQTKTAGQDIELDSNAPTMQDYVFIGWRCAQSDAVFKAGEVFSIDADVTLYAVWGQNCANCDATGTIDTRKTCSTCKGNGTIDTRKTCTSCDGTGDGATTTTKCSSCYGRGRKCASCGNASVTIIQGYGQVCSKCYSSSTTTCTWCDGLGSWTTTSSCSTCGGDGISGSKYSCSNCGGDGILGSISSCSVCNGGKYIEKSYSTYTVSLYQDNSLFDDANVYSKRPYKLTIPTKKGYTFMGWFDSPDGGTQYTDQDGVCLSAWADTSDKTLYAHWSLNYYAITYDCDQNVNINNMPTIYTVEDQDFVLNVQSREHYTFCWIVEDEEVESFDTSMAMNVDVHAIWTPIDYTISYDLDGGEGSNITTYNIETAAFSLTAPTKKGYTFVGWTGSNGDVPEKNVIISTSQPQDLSFTANWTLTVYTITYELYGGTNALKNPATFTMNDNIALKAATKDYYTFEGWYLDAAFTQRITNINGYANDLTLYARFIPDTFNATFEVTEGRHSYDITLVWGGDLQNEVLNYKSGDTLYPYEIDIPSRSGYLFNGWYLDSSFTTPLPKTYTVTTDITLYAKWFVKAVTSAKELTLGDYEYNCSGDGGSKTIYFYVSPEHSGETIVSYYLYFYKYNTNSYSVTSSQFRIEDYTTGKTLVSRSCYPSLTLNDYTTVTLEAGHTYMLRVYSAGTAGKAEVILAIGSDPVSTKWVMSSRATSQEKYGEPTQYPIPVRNDYDFAGWYDADGNPIHDIWDYTTTQTFYDRWTLHTFTIQYNLNGGSNSPLNPSAYTIADPAITLSDPTREGYTFLGWYTDPDFQNQITQINCEDRLDYTLYAKWIADFFAVSYELNGGVNNPSNIEMIGRTEDFTLLEPSKEGYTFVGWYLESYFSTKVTVLHGSEHRDQKVYAKWTPTSYTATLDYSGGENCPTIKFVSQGSVIKTVDLYKDKTFSYFTPEALADNLKFAGWYTDSACTTLFSFNTIVNRNVTVYAKWVSVNTDYEYVSLGGSYDVSISGVDNQYFTIVSPIAQSVTVSSVSGMDLFGAIYDSDMKLLYSCDDISDENLDFSITFTMGAGKVYYIVYKANQALVSGSGTINITGVQNPNTFITGDYTEIIESVAVKYDSSFTLPVPKREGYRFIGWFDENDTQITDGIWKFAADKTLTAKWDIYYTVVFKDLAGNTISSEKYCLGEEIVTPELPTKAPDETYIYHAKWDNDYTGACTGDAVYSPTFDVEYIEYTVIFADDDGTELSRNTYHWGDVVTVPADPTKATDKIGAHAFAGWDKEIVNCAGDATYTATYTVVSYIDYTVIFLDEDGTELSRNTYHWGDPVIAPTAPAKAADNTYTYTFSSWGKTVVNCAGDATYTAKYTRKYINYTVKFVNWDGTVLKSTTYHWGATVTEPWSTPKKEADEDYTYTFAGWDQEIVPCAGDATYTATYTAKYKPVVSVRINGISTNYNTLAEALENSSADDYNYWDLLRDVEEDITITKNIYLYLDGCDLVGDVTVADGVWLRVGDWYTRDFTVEDEDGYGRIVGKVEGTVKARSGYVMITEEDGISFHYVKMDVHTMTLRASEAGVYYQSSFSADEVVARNVDRYGVSLTLGWQTLTDENPGICSWYEDSFVAGEDANSANGTLLYGIMKTTNSDTENESNASRYIRGSAYIRLKDGSYIFGSATSRTFREQVELADAQWEELTEVQRSELIAMYNTYAEVMEGWNIPNTLQAAGN